MKQVSYQEYKLILIGKIERELMDVALYAPKANVSLSDILPNRQGSRMPIPCWVTEYSGVDLQVMDRKGNVDFEVYNGDKLGINASGSGSYKTDMFSIYSFPKPIDHDDLSNRFRNANSVISHLDRMVSKGFDKFIGTNTTMETERNLQSLLDRNIEVNEEGNYSPSTPSL